MGLGVGRNIGLLLHSPLLSLVDTGVSPDDGDQKHNAGLWGRHSEQQSQGQVLILFLREKNSSKSNLSLVVSNPTKQTY